MQVAVAGKGGSGKTTIAGTLARILARRGSMVRAIDADSNPNLAVTLGMDPAVAFAMSGLPPGLLRVVRDENGTSETVLVKAPREIFDEYGMDAPDGIRLIVGARVEHAGTG
ncbi:MAG: AAA family ATPase [Actinomycetota bacterium]